MPRADSHKCLNCGHFFDPHPRSKGRQKYCSAPVCQKASKAASQKKWLSKSENHTYFKGPENVQRVKDWRAKNPNYWKRSKNQSNSDLALQDELTTQDTDNKSKSGEYTARALQEDLMTQPFVLLGLIAHLTGAALQDDIVNTTLKLQQLGEDFFIHPHQTQGETNEKLFITQSTATPGNSSTVQLGRSPSSSR